MTSKNFGLGGIGADVQLGKGGPRVVVDTGVVKATKADGVTLEELKGAAPTTSDSFKTGAEPVVAGALYICTAAVAGPPAFVEKKLYYGKAGAWVEKDPVEGQTIHVTDALTGGNQTYLADHIYVWDADNSEWDDVGPYIAATKVMKTERGAVSHSNSEGQEVNVGDALPANAVVLGAVVAVSEVFDGATPTLKIGEPIGGTTDRIMTTAECDLKTVGIYKVDTRHLYGSSQQVVATITPDTSSTGHATVDLIYALI
jgi:hypothetical protein